MARTRFEITAELNALADLVETADDTMQDAIQAQVSVIELGLTSEQIRDNYEEDDELLEAALTAERWLRHDDEAPSENWEEELATA